MDAIGRREERLTSNDFTPRGLTANERSHCPRFRRTLGDDEFIT